MLGIERLQSKKINETEDSYRVPNPKGFAVKADLRQEWEAYQDEWNRINAECFHDAKKKLSDLIDYYRNDYQVELNKRVRLQQAIDEIAANVEKTIGLESKHTKDAIKEVNNQVVELTSEVMVSLSDYLSGLQVEFLKLDMSKLGDDVLFKKLLEIED